MTYIVQFRIPEETLQVAINEVMSVKGADCLEARPLPAGADPDPGPVSHSWFPKEQKA